MKISMEKVCLRASIFWKIYIKPISKSDVQERDIAYNLHWKGHFALSSNKISIWPGAEIWDLEELVLWGEGCCCFSQKSAQVCSVCNNSRFQVSRNISDFCICRPWRFWATWVCPGLAQWLTVCASTPESKSPHTREVSWGHSGILYHENSGMWWGWTAGLSPHGSCFPLHPCFPSFTNTRGVWRRQQKRTHLQWLRV